MTDKIAQLFYLSGFTLALFGVLICLLQRHDKPSFRALALTCLTASALLLEDVATFLFGDVVPPQVTVWTSIVWIGGHVFSAPIFWIYVVRLTMTCPTQKRHFSRHLVFPIGATLYAVLVLAFPISAQFEVWDDAYPYPTGWVAVYSLGLEGIILAAHVLWVGYAIAMTRRLSRHRSRLREYFASTENKELAWIYSLMGFIGLFGIVHLFYEIVSDTGIPVLIDAGGGLIIVLTILIWGLRQRPGFAEQTRQEATLKKYENSALTEAVAARIEQKLRRAMVDDKLHRDANLSLWTLANHVGASPNYVSQTLNDHIGVNFFDFVNSYRIAEAQTELADIKKTVLEIAFDVGFNSRSSFYSAFKKVTDQTPTEYRKSLSASA